MNQLWAPWRGKYVSKAGGEPGCLFCRALEERDRESSLVLHLGERSFVLMNLYPYNSGHLMVAPQRHVATLGETETATLSELMVQVQLAEKVLTRRYRPQGFNVGMNLGRVSGAGVPDHIHLHVVPRWEGDTNFMTVLGETRVVPEDPLEAARELRRLFQGETL